MKFKNYLLIILCANSIFVLCHCDIVPTTYRENEDALPNHLVNKFKNGIEQQNLYTILNSIEERLRNLDNIYTMQLSQTLETKLELYSRRLESLDNKIIRLEALVMLNLDKISENISTKNFKDDISKTNTYRKMDSLYETLANRMSYMDRKYDANFAKIQDKLDVTTAQLSKMEDTVSKRDVDLNTEISDAIFAIDDLKTTYKIMEEKLYNISEGTLNMSKLNYELAKRYTLDAKRSMNKLHDNIVGNLQYMDNKTSQTIKLVGDSNEILKHMRSELKEDFNNYANKVADMNSDIWKSSDTTEDDLETIAIVLNTTRTELQNGLRLLMLEIGKLESKDNDIFTPNIDRFQEIDAKLTTNFDKILMNQGLFMDSCHRLQMDEPQIEREISTMLEKLIDMLEKKLASETKDIRNFEKSLKSHDNRVNRNLHQANNNIVSLFEKFTVGNQQMVTEIKNVESHVGHLGTVLHSRKDQGEMSQNNLKMLVNKLEEIENNTDVKPEIQTVIRLLLEIEQKLENPFPKSPQQIHNSSVTVGEDTEQAILNVFGSKPGTSNKPSNSHIQSNVSGSKLLTTIKPKSSTDKSLCGFTGTKGDIPTGCQEKRPNRNQRKRKRPPKFDVRAGENDNSTRNEDEDDDYVEENVNSTTEVSEGLDTVDVGKV